MQLRDSPEEAAFREEVRAWLAVNLPPELRGRRGGASRFEDWGRDWSRKLGEAGYAALTSPTGASWSRSATPRLRATRADLPHGRHARARGRGAAAAADHRRGRVQRDLLHRRRGTGRPDARRAGTGLAGGDDDPDARAGRARLCARGRVRGLGRQAARPGPRARSRQPPERPGGEKLDRP